MIAIKEFHIQNFKSFKDVKIFFNPTLNVFTGVNNAGKTNMLEALSLWNKIFNKSISKAGRLVRDKNDKIRYNKEDYVMGITTNRYFDFQSIIDTVRSPNPEDIFYGADTKEFIILSVTFSKKEEGEITIPFTIKSAAGNYYYITLGYSDKNDFFDTFDFQQFNRFFTEFPSPLGFYYASPVASIRAREEFVTLPKLSDAVIKRTSSSYIRNRLHQLYRNYNNTEAFQQFKSNLNYILNNNNNVFDFEVVGDINKDIRTVVNIKNQKENIYRDISVFGSGTLQIIEILLNLFEPSTNLNIILLDEPDSHIHRDIQKRLIETLVRFAKNQQIFITTHNEALIRETLPENLFHLEQKSEAIYNPIGNQALIKVNPGFSGIYPSSINSVITALSGNTSALDFINAIEADVIVFVEGQDDAKSFDILLKQQILNKKKYVFWVLGGVNEVFENIKSYKQIFSTIKNEKTLWEKSVLIMDRDFLADEYVEKIEQVFIENKKLGIKTKIWNSYTFESTLFLDLELLAKLLVKWIKKYYQKEYNSQDILPKLIDNYQKFGEKLKKSGYNNKDFEDMGHRYKDYKQKLKNIFNSEVIPKNDLQIATLVRTHVTNSLNEEKLYKLMKKEDVSDIINGTLEEYNINFNIKNDFINLINSVDKSVWQQEWNFLNGI
ncbi:MAG: hypothetical protein EAZ85_03865 [Bacteroidetes bacterium]|nr:MAG: hypothetical protein EAZ85_03865 [Bacteroidota bacterium]TAG89424.1 MAG: hypothetical protein EAZ20_06495 [Bacteroidota bacterium]